MSKEKTEKALESVLSYIDKITEIGSKNLDTLISELEKSEVHQSEKQFQRYNTIKNVNNQGVVKFEIDRNDNANTYLTKEGFNKFITYLKEKIPDRTTNEERELTNDFVKFLENEVLSSGHYLLDKKKIDNFLEEFCNNNSDKIRQALLSKNERMIKGPIRNFGKTAGELREVGKSEDYIKQMDKTFNDSKNYLIENISECITVNFNRFTNYNNSVSWENIKT